jgi:soluble lytic murein transglycosylase-like protein
MAAAPVLAGEYAVLSTGFRIHADHHERDAGMVRLFTRDGVTQLPAASVVAFEAEDYTAAVSPKGAVGVMQLMPGTARALAADPRDPAQNIDAGARLLRELLIKYDGDVVKALSAYNAGVGAVERYRGMPPYSETQNYVDKVIRTYLRAGGR